MISYNNSAPITVNNVGQFGATEGTFGAYKQAAEYAADSKYWAMLSQKNYNSIDGILKEVERLYAEGSLLKEDIEQLKYDFENQNQTLLGLIQQTGEAIDNTNIAIGEANAATDQANQAVQDVLTQLDKISNMSVVATTLPPGSPATGEFDSSTGVFSFGIPEGQPGKDGKDGTDGTVSDIGDVAISTPVADDYGFFVDKDNGGLYRTPMSEIAKLVPAVVSFNGRTGPVVPAAGDYTVSQVTGAAASGVNSDINQILGLTTALSVAQGGTGAKDAAGARTNLSVDRLAQLANGETQLRNGLNNAYLYVNKDGNTWGCHSSTGAGPIALTLNQGGTGAKDAAGARTNLGLGPISTLSTVPIANGGTGATTEDAARISLGAAKSGVNSDITAMTNGVTFTQPVSVADAVDTTNAVNLGQISSDQGASLIGTLEGVPVQNIISNINTDIIQLKLNWAIENGYSDAEFTFTTGGTLTVNDLDKVVYDPVSKTWYSYAGTLPVVVPALFDPVGNDDWKPQTDPYLRDELSSSSIPGTSLIKHSDGLTLQEELDSILSVHSRVFSVDDPQFAGGAKGDSNGTVGNGTDDTAAIYACFQAAIEAGGGKIVFTPGKTYRTTYTVIYGSNMVIDMQGASIFFDVKPNDGSVFMPDSFQSYTKFTTDVIFMNGQINGRTGAGNGIGANRARRLTLFNIGSKYLHWHLFDGAGAQQVKIINCWSEGTQTAVFQVDNAAYNMACWGIDASGTTLPISFDAAGTGGWANCRDVLIMGCIVRNAKHSCVHIHNTNNQNIQVVNCHFEDSKAGVFADDNATFITTNTLIQGCTFIRCTNPISWGGGFSVLRILGNNFYGENTTNWYYGIRILLAAAGTLKTLAIKDNTFTGLYRPIYVNGVTGFAVDSNLFQTCGGTVAPSVGDNVSRENPLAILRLAGCKSGTVSNNLFQDCNDPVCISIARDEVDTTYSVSVEILNNISRGSGCLLSLYYADRCTVRDNKYTGLPTDFYGVYAASSCVALVLEGTYISQGSGRGIYLDGGARHVVRDNVLFSAGTDYAIWLGNCTSPRSSGNIITGGYAATQVTIGGTTTGAVLDEAFATTGKAGTATGVVVTYTTTAL